MSVMFLLTEALSVLISRFNNIKDFEMHVYCKLQTARPHVWGFRLALLTSRGRFYASHLPQALLSWIFCCVQTLKSNTLAIFLQIGYNFLANEQLPSLLLLLLLLFFFSRKALILSGNPVWRRIKLMCVTRCFTSW